MTENTPLPTTKADLLERIRREHDALERAIAGLSEAQMTAPLDAGGWSVKDLLAHITAWEQVLAQFHIARRPFVEAVPGVPASYQTAPVDEINDAFHRRDRDKPLADVLAAFRLSYERVVAAVESVDEADLFKHYTPPGRDSGARLIEWIAGDTYKHYAEHRATIAALARRG